MYINEQFITEEDVLFILETESVLDKSSNCKQYLIDPVFDKLDDINIRKKFIEFGDQFLELNTEMLSKEYPTTRVKYPRRYVDSLFEMFGFSLESINHILDICEKDIKGTIIMNQTMKKKPT